MLKNNINDEYLVNLYLITKYYTSNQCKICTFEINIDNYVKK